MGTSTHPFHIIDGALARTFPSRPSLLLPPTLLKPQYPKLTFQPYPGSLAQLHLKHPHSSQLAKQPTKHSSLNGSRPLWQTLLSQRQRLLHTMGIMHTRRMSCMLAVAVPALTLQTLTKYLTTSTTHRMRRRSKHRYIEAKNS